MDTELFPRPFALGEASTARQPRQPVRRRILPKFCNKGAISKRLTYDYPLLRRAANITNDEVHTLIWCGPTLTDRYNKIKLLSEIVIGMSSSEEHRTRVNIQCAALFKEQKIRTIFRNFVRIWLYKHYKGRFLNTEDPATMEEPRNPIYVYDTKQKGTYVFEASSLLKSTEKDLTYAQWLFPEPSHPKNPLTNLNWQIGARLHIVQQFRSLNIGSWIIESYIKSHCNLRMFRDIFMVPLKIRALNDLSRNPTDEDTIDFVCEFMEDMNEHFDTDNTVNLTILKWAAKNMYNHPYIASWREVWTTIYQYKIMYGEEYLDNHPILQNKLYKRAEKLLYDFKNIAELAEERLMRIPKRNPVVNPIQNVFIAQSSDSESESESEQTPSANYTLPIHMEVTLQRVREFQAARRIQALARGWLTRRAQPPGLVRESAEIILWPTVAQPNILVHLNNMETIQDLTERFVELLEKLEDGTQNTQAPR